MKKAIIGLFIVLLGLSVYFVYRQFLTLKRADQPQAVSQVAVDVTKPKIDPFIASIKAEMETRPPVQDVASPVGKVFYDDQRPECVVVAKEIQKSSVRDLVERVKVGKLQLIDNCWLDQAKLVPEFVSIARGGCTKFQETKELVDSARCSMEIQYLVLTMAGLATKDQERLQSISSVELLGQFLLNMFSDERTAQSNSEMEKISDEMVARFPESPTGAKIKLVALMIMGDSEKTNLEHSQKILSFAERAAQLNPSDPQAFVAQMYAHTLMDPTYAQLKFFLEDYTAKNPDSPFNSIALGQLAYRFGTEEEAIRHFQVAANDSRLPEEARKQYSEWIQNLRAKKEQPLTVSVSFPFDEIFK